MASSSSSDWPRRLAEPTEILCGGQVKISKQRKARPVRGFRVGTLLPSVRYPRMASKNATRTEELAVMFDTQHTLELTEQAVALDDQKYPQSWLD